MNNLVETIKKAAVDAMNAGEPTTFMYGTVLTVSPLSIQIDEDNKLILTSEFLQLTNAVRDYTVQIEDVEAGTTRKMMIKNALKINEKVVMIRQQGGQQYLVLDRRGIDVT